MTRDLVTLSAKVAVFAPHIFTRITPMYGGLWDSVAQADAMGYLLSGIPDADGLSSIHISVLARDLAPILFPEGV